MGIFDRFRSPNSREALDHLNTMNISKESAFAGAKSLIYSDPLFEEKDVQGTIQKLQQGNLVLLNFAELSREDKGKLDKLVAQLKEAVYRIDGDIARISQDKILASPPKVKFVRKRGIDPEA